MYLYLCQTQLFSREFKNSEQGVTDSAECQEAPLQAGIILRSNQLKAGDDFLLPCASEKLVTCQLEK